MARIASPPESILGQENEAMTTPRKTLRSALHVPYGGNAPQRRKERQQQEARLSCTTTSGILRPEAQTPLTNATSPRSHTSRARTGSTASAAATSGTASPFEYKSNLLNSLTHFFI
eukprot:CAMPEP_0176274532 /NCGR_PEP_ID=MMETSP0121_2-20121125/46775_1 /TAXON_ID=160619 /ORGANISM="Kryptoperidinium foliaceum, Strain CCMP 1326" /LENGTH=115 /DNA_ID=CAMNT_0017614733 /DNA_START=173 /DNA_END=517 /DNA_ORIENTATION=+